MIKKNTFIRCIRWTGIILSILLLALLLATWIINRGPLQDRIREAVSSRTVNTVAVQHLRLALFPRPHVSLSGVSLNVPGGVSGSIEGTKIYPEILPLLAGDVHVAALLLESPDITLDFPDEPASLHAEDQKSMFADGRAQIEGVMNSIREFAPRFSGRISNGRLSVRRDGRTSPVMHGLSGSLALLPKGLQVAMTAQAKRWGPVSVQGALQVMRSGVGVSNVTISGGRSSFTGLSARFFWRKVPYLEIQSGQGAVVLHELFVRRGLLGLEDELRDVNSVKGRITFTSMHFTGPLLHPEKWTLETTGEVEDIVVDTALLPGPVSIALGRFKATAKTISLTGLRAKLMDASFAASLSLAGSYDRVRSLELSLGGTIGPESLAWSYTRFSLPPRLLVRAPFSLSRVHFEWKRASGVSLSGTASFKSGPVVSVDLRKDRAELLIRRLAVEDDGARALLMLRKNKKFVDLTFNGSLKEETLNRIFLHDSFRHGGIRGNARAHIPFETPRETAVQGEFEAVDLVLFRARGLPLVAKHVILFGGNRTVFVRNGFFTWGEIPVDAQGYVQATPEGFLVDMELAAGSVNINALQQMFAPKEEEESTGGGAKSDLPNLQLRGTIRVTAENVSYGRYVLSPVSAGILMQNHNVRMKIVEAKLCGVSFPGNVQPAQKGIKMDLVPQAAPQPLEPALQCMFKAKTRITGTYNLFGELHGQGTGIDMVRSLNGWMEFRAEKGKIYEYPLLARIFRFLSVTELLRGKVPDLGRDGFAYDRIRIKGDISGGKLVLREATVEGSTMNLAAEGKIDFAENSMDITVLVAPFKTLDYLLSKIPILRNILANRLISIPVRVSGGLHDPRVTPLQPKAVGKNLLNVMKKTLELPFRILDPLFGR